MVESVDKRDDRKLKAEPAALPSGASTYLPADAQPLSAQLRPNEAGEGEEQVASAREAGAAHAAAAGIITPASAAGPENVQLHDPLSTATDAFQDAPPHARIPLLEATPQLQASSPRESSPPGDAALHLPMEALPAEKEESARIIPFVPRGGLVRDAVSAMQPEPPFARLGTGPAAALSAPAAIAARALPQAQPPPPSGFRRAPGWRLDAAGSAGARHDGSPEMGPLRIFWRKARRGLRWVFIAVAALAAAYALTVLLLVVAYRWVNPPTSTLMLGQAMSGTQIAQRWMPLDRMSPNLLHAVILSEDGQFCRHHGVDWLAMREAIEQSLDGAARGGSTITMQTVKNLFLWPSKSYVRKAIEIPLALGSEAVWPKRRILEMYLNIAEWGPGIFGAEAAARYHFGKSAANLTVREASLLAVSLPNPFEREAGQPGPGTQRLADRLQVRMRRVPRASACVLPTGGNFRRLGVADAGEPR